MGGLSLPPLCGFSPPPCGSSPPPMCGIPLPTLIVGPFQLNLNFPIYLSQNLSIHAHIFIPKSYEFAQGGDHLCSSVGLVCNLCIAGYFAFCGSWFVE